MPHVNPFECVDVMFKLTKDNAAKEGTKDNKRAALKARKKVLKKSPVGFRNSVQVSKCMLPGEVSLPADVEALLRIDALSEADMDACRDADDVYAECTMLIASSRV